MTPRYTMCGDTATVTGRILNLPPNIPAYEPAFIPRLARMLSEPHNSQITFRHIASILATPTGRAYFRSSPLGRSNLLLPKPSGQLSTPSQPQDLVLAN